MQIVEVEKEPWTPLVSRDESVPVSAQQSFVFHSLKGEDFVDKILIQGGRGTGKTEIAIFVWLMYVWKGYGKNWTGLVIRTQFGAVKETHKKALDVISSYYTEEVDFTTYTSNDNLSITFHTGESLHFRHVSNEKEFENKFKGLEYQFILFEELTSWEKGDLFDLMMTCLRCRENDDPEKNPPLMVRATTNPDGPGRKWVKRRFILQSDSGIVLKEVEDHPFLEGETVTTTQMHIYTTMKENYKLNSAYVKNVMALKNTNYHKYLQHMFGVWDDFDDTLLYNSVYDPSSQFIEDFEIPSNVILKRAGDWGTSDPFCFLWYFKHKGGSIKRKNGRYWTPPEGSIIIVREWYGAESITNPSKGLQMSAEKVAREMNKIEKLVFKQHQVQPGPCDAYIKNGYKTGQVTNYDFFKKESILFSTAFKSKDSIETGVLIIRDLLEATKNFHEHQTEAPCLFFFNSCKFLRETMFSLKADPENLDRPESKQDDHANDVVRYIVTEALNNSFAKPL